jgi:hypothetical protein
MKIPDEVVNYHQHLNTFSTPPNPMEIPDEVVNDRRTPPIPMTIQRVGALSSYSWTWVFGVVAVFGL